MSKACAVVVVDYANGLHEGITYGRTTKTKALLFEGLAHGF